MRHALVLLVALVAPVAVLTASTAARADAYEAALTPVVGGGAARVAEDGTAAKLVPAVGVGLRLSHAWRNALAWDLQLRGQHATAADFADATVSINGRPAVGDVTRSTTAIDAQLGASLRLGDAGLHPILRLGAGPLVRRRSGSDLGAMPDAVAPAVDLDLVASVSLGVDLRLSSGAAIALAIQLDHAQPLTGAPPLDVIGVSLSYSRIWYPRWWVPAW